MHTDEPDHINDDDGSILPTLFTPEQAVKFLDKEIIYLKSKVKIVNITSDSIGCNTGLFVTYISYKELAKYKVETIDGEKLYGN